MTSAIAYLVHDLSDASIARRVRMFRHGGATVRLAGFRRGEAKGKVEGEVPLELGQTADAALLKRAGSVAKVLRDLECLRPVIEGADVIVARNLEMLAIAVAAKRRFAEGASLVYECLDIHWTLLAKSPVGVLVRALEDALLRHVDLILTSSPAFVTNYFAPRKFEAKTLLVENKVLLAADAPEPAHIVRPAGPPWRIGYFGMLRCRASLEILAALAQVLDGKVEVIIRGKPSPAVFADLAAECAFMDHVRFLGPYRGESELARIYGEVHFAWAIDYYEDGRNSAWLLPNRIYESTCYGAVPLALAGVETGRWLSRHDAGVLVDHPPYKDLVGFFNTLDEAAYEALARKVSLVPRQDVALNIEDCSRLVAHLAESAGAGRAPRSRPLTVTGVTHDRALPGE